MSDSIVPRRTRIFSGFDLFLLNIGEPQCLQKNFLFQVLLQKHLVHLRLK